MSKLFQKGKDKNILQFYKMLLLFFKKLGEKNAILGNKQDS